MQLTVLVCSIQREPIPGELRYQWMRELCPDCRVVHITDELPQEPSEHPRFWELWEQAIRRHLPSGPEYVFASERYGHKLAEVLGSRFVMVDMARAAVPVSGSAVREDPLRHWQFIPPPVRPYFIKRVCLFGPESTGKSTLASRLAEHYQTLRVSEFARPLLEPRLGRCVASDIPCIARGQLASEAALARQANRVLFCDTDLLTTTIWSRELFGDCPPWVEAQAERQRYDLYLLLDVDVPWVDDQQRFLPHRRQAFFEQCEQALRRRGRPYQIIRGNWEDRFTQACAAVDQLLTV